MIWLARHLCGLLVFALVVASAATHAQQSVDGTACVKPLDQKLALLPKAIAQLERDVVHKEAISSPRMTASGVRAAQG